MDDGRTGEARPSPVDHDDRPSGLRGEAAMKLGLINSAWAQAGQDTAFGIRMTREIGFDSIDVFADPLDDADEAERALIKVECDRAGLPIVSVACVALGLVDFNPSVRRFHLDRCPGLPRHGPASSRQKTSCWFWGNTSGRKEVIPPAEQWELRRSTSVRDPGRIREPRRWGWRSPWSLSPSGSRS